MEDSYKMYIIVNNDLKMEKGKIAAQVGHLVGSITEEIMIGHFQGYKLFNQIFQDYQIWKSNGSAKIVLKASNDQIMQILDESSNCRNVIDQGKTQVDPGSLTVIGFFPMREKKVNPMIKKLKLL